MEHYVESHKRFFYRRMVTVAIPVVFQHLITIGLNLADTVMIGGLGELQLAAVGAANQVYGVFFTIVFGVISGGIVYLTQYFGAKNFRKIYGILGFDLVVTLGLSLLFFIVIQFNSAGIIGIFAKNPQVITYGMDYIKIVSFSYILSGISFVISFNSRGVQILKVPTIISAVCLLINIVLNYCLIFGKLGFSFLGVEGAAFATLIARGIELLALIIFILKDKNHPFHTAIKNIFYVDKGLWKSLVKMSSPVVLSETGWSLSVALVFAIYGKIGAEALAVVQIGTVTCQLFQGFFFGLGNGGAVVIGESLGCGRHSEVQMQGSRILKLSLIFSIIMVVLIVASTKPLDLIYHFNQSTMNLLRWSMYAFAITMVPRMIAYILQCGILRSGGDTFFCMVIELFSNLVLEVLLAYVAVVIMGLSLPTAILIGGLGNTVKCIIMYVRFKSEKWINILID